MATGLIYLVYGAVVRQIAAGGPWSACVVEIGCL